MENIFIKKQQITDFTLLKDYCFFNSREHAEIFSNNFNLLKNKNNDLNTVFVNLTHQYTFDKRANICLFSEIDHFRSQIYNNILLEKNTASFNESEDYKYIIKAFKDHEYTTIPKNQFDGFTYMTLCMNDCIVQYKMNFDELRLLQSENEFIKKVQSDSNKYNLDMHLINQKEVPHKLKI